MAAAIWLDPTKKVGIPVISSDCVVS